MVKELNNPIINIDNKVEKFITKNEVLNSRSKHIDIKHYFIKEKLIDGLFNLKRVCSVDNIADIFTKPPKDKISYGILRDKLGIMKILSGNASGGENTVIKN